jgi:hypothetical protein
MAYGDKKDMNYWYYARRRICAKMKLFEVKHGGHAVSHRSLIAAATVCQGAPREGRLDGP